MTRFFLELDPNSDYWIAFCKLLNAWGMNSFLELICRIKGWDY
jgi:hypothetical protein